MIFTNIPTNMASFQEPLIYEFECGTEADGLEEIEVRIWRTKGELLARKILYGGTDTMRVDIAPYLRQMMAPEVMMAPECCAVSESPYNIDIEVEVLGIKSESRHFMAAKSGDSGLVTMLSAQIEHRTMAYDEFDAVGLVMSGESPVEVVIEAYDKSSSIGSLSFEVEGVGQKVVSVRPADFGPTLRSMTMRILCEQAQVASVEYEVRTNLTTAERVGWLNEHLAPEFYTFPLRKSLLVEVTRRHMASIWGKEAAAVERRNELKLISAYEPDAQIKVLADVLSSQKVWLQRGGEAEAVELATQRAMISPSEGVGFIELDLQAAKRGVLLW